MLGALGTVLIGIVSADEGHELSDRGGAQPAHRARSGIVVALPDDEAGHDGQRPVAHERLPTGRGGVELPKAVAFGPVASGQVVGKLELYTSELDCRTSPIISPEYPGQPPTL